ncbi:SKP1 component [Corchorus olitorius]|uniref:SKP1 component n=1 Tax=Corchorus olitorius TaxID=93759 RepID=A0A1R3JE21_9ROSI|nr:SKP1 component [Corchorus olitorius]
MLKLKSQDNQIFEVEEAVAMQSTVIKGMVEDGCGGTDGVVSLPMVNGEILTRIIEWCKKHVNIVDKGGEKEELGVKFS